jgi:hypothetical protein
VRLRRAFRFGFRGSLLVPLGGLVFLAVATLGVRAGWHHQLYRALFYPVVAQRVAGGAETPDATVVALEQFVYENVRTPGDVPIVDDDAADILQRGYGYCDQASLAFARLAQERGIPARMLFLYDDQGNSPHTVAQVFLNGDWRVVDVLYGVIPRRPDGQIATVADLLAAPDLLGTSRVNVDWYRRAQPIPLVAADATHAGAVLEWLGEQAAHLPAPAIALLQDAYLHLPAPTYVDTEGHLVEDFRAPDSRLYRTARNQQLFGRARAAVQTYQRLRSRYPLSQYADDALYQQALQDLTVQDQPSRAVRQLTILLTNDPGTPWQADAVYFAGLAEAQLGNCPAAATDFTRVVASDANGREDAQTRLASLRCG